MSATEIVKFSTAVDFKKVIAKEYMTQIENFFADKTKAMRFLSGMMASIQRNPKLLECSGESLINGFIMMAQLRFMPSSVSGQAYMIPYENSKDIGNGKYAKVMEANFQIGYQGLVTLFYRAGVRKIISEIVREHDDFSSENGEISHKIDLKKNLAERGKAIGCYARFTLPSGEITTKWMHRDDILAHGKKFSKSFNSAKSPWNPANDPELWMWKKTVVIQGGKLVDKSDELNTALEADFKDSIIGDRLEPAKELAQSLKMGAGLKPNDKPHGKEKDAEGEGDQGETDHAQGSEGDEAGS